MFRHHRHHRHGAFAAAGATHRMGRRSERIFDHGDLRLIILRLIAERPRHGYEIIKDIEEMVGGAYSPSPGVVYPTLTLLEELGQVTVEAASGGKKLYRITAEGQSAVEGEKAATDAILARMSAVHDRFEGPSPRIGRAMGNLANAIRVRMSSGSLDGAQLDAIVEAIDSAARTVERA
jgi:DNA-binding PadR family transcriptional regulator